MLVETEKLHTKKPDILQAALKLFVEKGIDGTTIRDIAQEAGVGEGTLYRHFKSKEEMAWQLFYQNLKQFTRELRRPADRPDRRGGGGLLARGGQGVITAYPETPLSPRLFLKEMPSPGGFSDSVVSRIHGKERR